MAQRLEVQLTDDIDGTEIRSGKGETVSFGLDGNSYEIDLKPRTRVCFARPCGRTSMPDARSRAHAAARSAPRSLPTLVP